MIIAAATAEQIMTISVVAKLTLKVSGTFAASAEVDRASGSRAQVANTAKAENRMMNFFMVIYVPRILFLGVAVDILFLSGFGLTGGRRLLLHGIIADAAACGNYDYRDDDPDDSG